MMLLSNKMKAKVLRRVALCCALLIFLCSCRGSGPRPPAPAIFNSLELRVTIVKAFPHGTDYELINLKGQELAKQCGSYLSSRANREVPSTAKLQPVFSKADTQTQRLTPLALSRISLALDNMFASKTAQLPPAGPPLGLDSPAFVELSLRSATKNIHIQSDYRSISTLAPDLEKLLVELSLATESPCANTPIIYAR